MMSKKCIIGFLYTTRHGPSQLVELTHENVGHHRMASQPLWCFMVFFFDGFLIKVNPQLPSLKLTAKAHENPIFLGKYHQNGGFSSQLC